MDVEILIRAIVRQTTVLVARLATDGGQRASLAGISDQVFVDMVLELERLGISRKVSADMFGIRLRTYLRRIRRKTDFPVRRRKSLWEQVLEFVTSRGPVTRCKVLLEFASESGPQVRAVLHDLSVSGLLLASGAGDATCYQAGRPRAAANTNGGSEETEHSIGELQAALANLEATLNELRSKVGNDRGCS